MLVSLVRCGNSPTEAEAPTKFVSVNINTGRDSGLRILAGTDTLTSPVSVLVPAGGSLLVSIPKDQQFDFDSLVVGKDTRYRFFGWTDTAGSSEEREWTSRGPDSLSARFSKEYKVQVSSLPDIGSNIGDTSWHAEGGFLTLLAPEVPGFAFQEWRVDGVTTSSLPMITLAVMGPKDIKAAYRVTHLLTIQSDWSSGLSVILGDSLFTTPVRKEVPDGDSIRLVIPQNQPMDTSSFIDSNNVRLQVAFWNKGADRAITGPPGDLAETIRMDSAMSIFIPIKRIFKVVIQSSSDSEGSYSLGTGPITGLSPTAGKISAQSSIQYQTPMPPAPRINWCPENKILHLKAIAKAGFLFSHWTLDGQPFGTEDTLSFEVKAPTYIRAVFVQRYALHVATWPDTGMTIGIDDSTVQAPWSLDYPSPNQVRISIPPTQEKDLQSLLPGPDARYRFARWKEDGATVNPRMLEVRGLESFTAEFNVSFRLISIIPDLRGKIDTADIWMPKDSIAVMVAQTQEGYGVNYWDVNGKRVNGGDTLTMKVTEPTLVKAHVAALNIGLQMAELLPQWQPALGGDGGEMAMRMLAKYTGDCQIYGSGDGVKSAGETLRAAMLATTRIDLGRKVLSQEIQRRFQGPGYTVEVAKMEVYPGNFLPVNIYIPDNTEPKSCPLIITPPGFNQGASLDLVQERAANMAIMGMVVIVPEGFNSNGARAAFQGNNNYLLYGRELIGLPSSNSMFLQEMVSSITWAIETLPQVDPARIGVTGYSYGGGMAVELAQLDTRIRSLSVPATNFGGQCGAVPLAPDLYVEASYGPGFVWSPPPETPILPPNSDVTMLYPRYLQTTAGLLDAGAPSAVMKKVMETAGEWYGLGGFTDRLLFQADGSDHNFSLPRRENTYSWFRYSLFGDSLHSVPEKEVPLFTPAELEPDITGSTTLVNELESFVDVQYASRFSHFWPQGDYTGRVEKGMQELFGGFKPERIQILPAWEKAASGELDVKAFRIQYAGQALPLFIFENPARNDTTQVLYLPLHGVREDSSALIDLISHYHRVFCVDYLGIGEVRSNSIMLHTLARQFMFNDPSLPKLVVESLRSYLVTLDRPVDVYGNGWASSFFAASLKYLEPDKTRVLRMEGVPANELDYLRSGNKTPDLLLWGGLFSKVTATEIEAAALARP